MKKLVVTIGKFDCLSQKHFHLIREMRKLALPDGEIAVIIFDDYSCFVRDKKFPVQSLEQRKNNLNFLVNEKNVFTCFSNDPSDILLSLKKADRLLYAGYDDNKEFLGRGALKERNASFRFIKQYGDK